MPRSKKTKIEVKENAQPESTDWAAIAKLVDRVRKTKKKAEENLCFDQIVETLRPRMKNLCSKFNIPGLDQNDIWQEALKALRYKAIEDYDKSRGTCEGPAPFDRFALLCIKRHLATELKTSHQIKKRAMNGYISLSQDRNESNDELSLINILPAKKGDVLKIVERKEYMTTLVSKLLDKLTKFETDVFMLYLEKYTYKEISFIINKRGNKKQVKIKSIDNGLARVKNKAQAIFSKYGEQNPKDPAAKIVSEFIDDTFAGIDDETGAE